MGVVVRPARDVKVGMMAKVNSFISKNLPGIGDRMATKQPKNLERDEPARDPEGTLYRPGEEGRTHGNHAKA